MVRSLSYSRCYHFSLIGYKWVPLNPNMDKSKSQLIRSLLEIKLISFMLNPHSCMFLLGLCLFGLSVRFFLCSQQLTLYLSQLRKFNQTELLQVSSLWNQKFPFGGSVGDEANFCSQIYSFFSIFAEECRILLGLPGVGCAPLFALIFLQGAFFARHFFQHDIY